MSLQAEGAGGDQSSAPVSGRQRLWSTLFPCFRGSRRHDKETAARPRRRKRTVPVDSAGDHDEAVSPASPARRRRGCGFLPPLSSCVPGLKRNVEGSDSWQRRRELPPPPRNAKAPPPPRHDVAPAATRGAIAKSPRAAAAARGSSSTSST
uniref:Uncharacterized protein n=1 Tax=Leersia perrieri TaxID=77586 RepID=A0A0D9XKV0_9ORYZ